MSAAAQDSLLAAREDLNVSDEALEQMALRLMSPSEFAANAQANAAPKPKAKPKGKSKPKAKPKSNHQRD